MARSARQHIYTPRTAHTHTLAASRRRGTLTAAPAPPPPPCTARRVERVLAGCGISLIWVSHDPGQPLRAAPRGRILEMPLGRVVPIQQLLPKDGEQL